MVTHYGPSSQETETGGFLFETSQSYTCEPRLMGSEGSGGEGLLNCVSILGESAVPNYQMGIFDSCLMEAAKMNQTLVSFPQDYHQGRMAGGNACNWEPRELGKGFWWVFVYSLDFLTAKKHMM